MNCNDCAKIFCKNRGTECTDKITFVQAGQIDKPKIEKSADEIQDKILEAIEKALGNPNVGNPTRSNPIYEYVATFNTGTLTKYIGK